MSRDVGNMFLTSIDNGRCHYEQVRCQSESFRENYHKREIMSVWAECYMRYNGGYEMSRDVGNMFLTSLDKVDDFVYRGHGVPEEFWETFHIWKQCQRGADFLLRVNPNFRGCQVGPMVSQSAHVFHRNFPEFI